MSRPRSREQAVVAVCFSPAKASLCECDSPMLYILVILTGSRAASNDALAMVDGCGLKRRRIAAQVGAPQRHTTEDYPSSVIT